MKGAWGGKAERTGLPSRRRSEQGLEVRGQVQENTVRTGVRYGPQSPVPAVLQGGGGMRGTPVEMALQWTGGWGWQGRSQGRGPSPSLGVRGRRLPSSVWRTRMEEAPERDRGPA